MSVSANFNMFCDELKISDKKKSIISLRYNSINKKLNNDFWSLNTSYGGVYTGCYGRETASDGIKEIDLIFEMPSHLLLIYNECGGKPQARVLEDVRRSIATMYPATTIDKEGKKIEVKFSDGMTFNVFPAFIKDGGSYIFADASGKGKWNIKKPVALADAICKGDKITNQNLRKLCRMVKVWKQNYDVKIKDVLIDTLVYEFLLSSKKTYDSYAHFDVMCFDFFKYLKNQESSKTVWDSIGCDEKIHNSDNFRYKAVVAYFKIEQAIKLGLSNKKYASIQKWREVFGYKFPETVPLDDQIKGLYEKATSISTEQKKCVKILSQKLLTFLVVQVFLALLIVAGVLVVGYTNNFDLGLSLFAVSSVVFLVILYFQKYNLADIVKRHKKSVVRIDWIQRELLSLTQSLNHDGLGIAVLRSRLDELRFEITRVYTGADTFDDKRYAKALEKIKTISKITKKVPSLNKGKIDIPVWEHNKFYLENKVQCLMNYRN